MAAAAGAAALTFAKCRSVCIGNYRPDTGNMRRAAAAANTKETCGIAPGGAAAKGARCLFWRDIVDCIELLQCASETTRRPIKVRQSVTPECYRT